MSSPANPNQAVRNLMLLESQSFGHRKPYWFYALIQILIAAM